MNMIRSLSFFPPVIQQPTTRPAPVSPAPVVEPWSSDSVQLGAVPRSAQPASKVEPLVAVSIPSNLQAFQVLDEATGTIHCAHPKMLEARLHRLEGKGITLIAVRHGESEANAASGGALMSGQSETPLSALGRQQAQQAASKMYDQLGGDAWLTSCGQDASKLPVLYSSPLSRAHDTGLALVQHLQGRLQELSDSARLLPVQSKLLSEQIKLRDDPDLQEINFGKFENRPAAEAAAQYPNFGKGVDFTHRFPGGESGIDVFNRMDRFFNKVEDQHAGRTVIFFGHTMSVGLGSILLGQVVHNDAGALKVDRGKILNAAPMTLAQAAPAPQPQEYLLAGQ